MTERRQRNELAEKAFFTSMAFRCRSEQELNALSDEALILHAREARAAGACRQSFNALAILVYGYEDTVQRRLTLRVPSEVVEDLTHDALVRAITSAFDGHAVGQFRSWLNIITDRTAADFYRRRERQLQAAPLPGESWDSAQRWSDEPAHDGEQGAAEVRILADEVLAELTDRHRQVVQMHVFAGYTATETCESIEGISADNVAQIASRYRAKLRRRLEAGRSDDRR